jgi:ubiquinone/menaquinone biosynthesis C-methylase UbiE
MKHPLHKYEKLKRYMHAIEMLTPSRSDAILEIGCGTGYQIPQVAETCGAYIGLDVSEKSIQYCKSKGKVELIVGDAENLPIRDSSLNLILMIDVLENLDNPIKALAEMRRVLKKRGKAVVSVPNWRSLFGLAKALVGRLVDWRSLSEFIPPIDNWYTPSSIAEILSKSGFQIVEMRGSFFLPPFFIFEKYFVPPLSVIPRFYDFLEEKLSKNKKVKQFGYHVILMCVKP